MQSPKIWILCAGSVVALAGLMLAQEQGPKGNPSETVSKPRNPNANTNTTGDSTGGNLPKIPSQYNRKDKIDTSNLPTYKSEVDMVTVDAAVTDGRGHFIPGIPAGNFRVLEDDVPQKIIKVEPGVAPLTLAMVIEFSNRFQQFWGPAWYQTLELAWGFASTLQPNDYVAVVAYDLRPEILTDFTTDRSKTQEALNRLQIPAFSEANLFDAVTDTADRMSGIQGRKAVLLISSGIDTFSKLTYDQTRKNLQEAGVPVYAIGLMQTLRELMDAYGMMGPIQRMDFLQADNQLRTFAKETGGMAFFPRFEGEFPGIFQQIQVALRNQYVITYAPSNTKHDGTFRKIKVELVNPATNQPLAVKNEKGKPIKYQIIAKAGYKAPRVVE